MMPDVSDACRNAWRKRFERSSTTRRHMQYWGILACAALVVGCAAQSQQQVPPTTQPQRRPSSAQTASLNANTDPCAMRLHDIGGALLFYSGHFNRMPQKLDDLRFLPGFEHLESTCPTSGKPYIYKPDGIPMPDKISFLVLYDSDAAHLGVRWGLQITPARAVAPREWPPGSGNMVQPQSAPTATVIPLPDSIFLMLPSQ
jgi:hypothetical protein